MCESKDDDYVSTGQFSAVHKPQIWHPFTSISAPLPINIKNGKGSYLYDENDKSYLDLISSWWVNLHGHAHPDIANSIYEQAVKLEHVIFSGFTHEPASNLCKNLHSILPGPLEHFFFSDNGSTAVEVALKMAYQFWYNNQQKEKNLFLCFEGGYHGDTFGSMSVGKKSGFHNIFDKFLFNVLSIPYPATWDHDDEVESKNNYALSILEEHLNRHKSQIAAIILEPLVQGAAGMKICTVDFLKRVIELVRKYNILVIFDEVMTGFGRTGTYFALEQTGIIPDFLCLSKGISGGFLPLALTITTSQIYNSFLNQSNDYVFAHGHSYTANPLACAAANSSLEILLRKVTKDKLQEINQTHIKCMQELKKSCPLLLHPRVLGTISAFEVKYDNKNLNGHNLNSILKARFLEHGLLIRPLGNTIYLLPPYSITSEELVLSYQKISDILNKELG